MDEMIRGILNQKLCITFVALFGENTVHDLVKIATVQADIQELIRAPHDVDKVELVEKPSLPKRSKSLSASPSDKKNLCSKKRSCRSSKFKSKKSLSPFPQNEFSSSKYSNRSCHSTLVLLPVDERFCTALDYYT